MPADTLPHVAAEHSMEAQPKRQSTIEIVSVYVYVLCMARAAWCCYARHLARTKPAAKPSATAAASSATRASAARVLTGFIADCAKGLKTGRWSTRESRRS